MRRARSPIKRNLIVPERTTSALAKAFAWWIDYAWVSWRQVRLIFTLPRWRRVPDSYSAGARAPIVLVPGVYEKWQFLKPIADRLNAGGYPVYVVAELGYNLRDIPASAGIVASFIAARDLRNVVIVAHSKGGLIGKHLMTIDDKQGCVDHVVAVNSPFSGSAYARYIPLRSVRAFSPAEPTLAMLGGRRERNSGITSIYSRFDPHIPGGSALDGARNVRLPLMGHFRPLGQRLLIDTVEHAVEHAIERALDGEVGHERTSWRERMSLAIQLVRTGRR